MRLASRVLSITNNLSFICSLLVGVVANAEQGRDDILCEEKGVSG